MKGFKAFNVNSLESFTSHVNKVDEENRDIQKSLKRQIEQKNKISVIKAFVDSSILQDDNYIEQTKFVSSLALNGLSSHLNLINVDNLDATRSDLDNARTTIALYDNVAATIKKHYSKSYLSALKPLESFRESLYAKLSENITQSALSTQWSLLNDSDVSRQFRNIQPLGLFLGGDGYGYTKISLSALNHDFSIWLNNFIDQVSYCGAGFTTVANLVHGSDMYIFENCLPELEKSTYFDPLLSDLSIDEYEVWMEDDEVSVRNYLAEKLAACLNFKASFTGSKEKARSDYHNDLIDNLELDDEIEFLINSCNSLKEYASAYGIVSMDVIGLNVIHEDNHQYPMHELTNITSSLTKLLTLAPNPTSQIETDIISYLTQVISNAKEVRHVSLETDQLSINDARVIHMEVGGENEAVQECVHMHETSTLMQISEGSWTGVEDMDSNDIKDLIEGEALSAAIINGLYVLVDSPLNMSNKMF